MRSLASIIGGETFSPANLDDLVELVEGIKNSFPKKKPADVSMQEIARVLTELLPDTDLDKLSQLLNSGLHADAPAFKEEDAGFALTSLAIAAQQKNDIRNKKAKPLKEEIAALEQFESQSPKSKKFSDQIKEMREIIYIAEKIQARSVDSRINRIKINVTMLNELAAKLPSYIKNYPAYAGDNIGIASYMRKYNSHFHMAVDALSLPEKQDIDKLCQRCEEEADILIMQICTAIGERIEAQHADISAGGLIKIKDDYYNVMGSLDQLTAPIDNEIAYQEMNTKFKDMVTALINLCEQLPDSRAEAEYRRKEDIAKAEVASEFPSEEFKYFLMPIDLRHSKNAFVSSQIAITEQNLGAIEDQDKFILSGQPSQEPTKNLFQIIKDAKREHLIQGKSYKANSLLTLANAEALLKKEFGKDNALHAMTHFDQGASLIVASGVGHGVTPAEEMMTEAPLTLKPPINVDMNPVLESSEGKESTTTDLRALEESQKKAMADAVRRNAPAPGVLQNLYAKHDGVLYRSVRLNYFRLDVDAQRLDADGKVLWDISKPENWKLKVNLKSLYWASKDGFVEVCTATDSPLICNALVKDSNDISTANLPTPHQQLEAMVKLVLDVEKDATNELMRISGGALPDAKLEDKVEPDSPSSPTNKEMNYMQKRAVLESVLTQVKDFKEGKHTFDDLAASIPKIYLQAAKIEHAGDWTTFFKNKLGYDRVSTTARIIGELGDKLTAMKKDMDNSASMYKRENSSLVEVPQHTERTTLSLRGA